MDKPIPKITIKLGAQFDSVVITEGSQVTSFDRSQMPRQDKAKLRRMLVAGWRQAHGG